MQIVDPSQFLWTEKYRPHCIDDCILSKRLKKHFKDIVEHGEIPNILLYGPAGVGKTSVAKALAEEMDRTLLFINGSMEGNIDTLRGRIKNFASTASLDGEAKVVVIDEADYLNPQSTQPALRAFMEEFSKTCRFILTCNYQNKILAPIRSRCSEVRFDIQKAEMPKIAAQLHNRVKDILETEKVEYEEKVIPIFIKKYFPDFRKVISDVQKCSTTGVLDTSLIGTAFEKSLKQLIKILRTKKFPKIREWVVQNLDNDTATIYRALYDHLTKDMDEESIPQAVLIIAEYQYKSAFSADNEITLVACLTEIMAQCQWKGE